MKVLGLIILLFIVKSARCEGFSALSCAIGKTVATFVEQQIATGIFKLSKTESVLSVNNYISFYLYTRENPKGQRLVINDTEVLLLSSFNVYRETKIIAHGYLASKDTSSSKTLRDAFLNTGNYNVIVIDWWPMQSIWGRIPIDYWTVASYVVKIGKHVARMIDFLEEHGMNSKTTTLVGHSLGAHIMGIASYNSREKVHYIVGLDPASPSFDTRKPRDRLSIDDATIVEVIHTDEGNCGMSSPIGHYDFYPNGGSKQPGCKDNKCSHTRAFELYADSLQNPHPFYAYKCSDFQSVKSGNCSGDVAVMGGRQMKSLSETQGMFYLETSDSYPFVLGR